MTRICAGGAYVPRSRVTADAVADVWGTFRAPGIDRTAVPAADEDPVTMGYAAARRAIDAGERDAGTIARLHYGSTSPPLAEEEVTARLCSSLDLPDGVATATYTGSTRAGVQALVGAVQADTATLVVAADAPQADPDSRLGHAAGAGAGAVLVTPEGAASIEATASHTAAYPGTRIRRHGDSRTHEPGVRTYERRAFRETLVGAIDRLDTGVETVDAAAIQAPDGDRPYRVADAVGIAETAVETGICVRDTGDLGAASPIVGLVEAIDADAEQILVAGYGSGAGASVVSVTGGDAVPVERAVAGNQEVSYAVAQRRRGAFDGRPVAGGGAHVSLPAWHRSLPQRHRLEAGACRSCDELAFPPSGACRSCGATKGYDPVAVAGTGTVVATTTIRKGGAPPEFADQQIRGGAYASAIVDLDVDGERSVRVPLQVVLMGDAEVGVGDRVTTTLRRIYEQEGVPRYGLKGVPMSVTR